MADSDKDKEKDKEVEQKIKDAGNAVEPKDKDALANIRRRTGAGREGNGDQGKKGKKK